MSNLFRQQAIEQKTNRLHGDILILPRFSHSILISILLVWLIALMFWLINSTYARKETVMGWLAPPEGIIRVYPEGEGIIKEILISDGDIVAKDQPLFVINGDRTLEGGDHLEDRLLIEFKNQHQLLNEQLKRSRTIFQSRILDISQRITAANQDLALLAEQTTLLAQRHKLIKEQVTRSTPLKLKGLIPQQELESLVAQELALRSEKQGLLREQINRSNLVQQLQTEQDLLPQENANNQSQLQTRLSDLEQRIAQLHGNRAHIIKASRTGIASNLQARIGQKVQPTSTVPLMTLAPANAQLTAHILVPVRSAGFVELGQQLDIRFNAFPYQKFGIYAGELKDISNTILLPNELLNAPIPIQEPTYLITAKLAQQNVEAYGKQFPLKSGMTLSADIQLSERSLLQWLFEPLYSLKGRI